VSTVGGPGDRQADAALCAKAKREPTLTQRVVSAISKGRGMAQVAEEIDEDQDLDDDTIEKVRQRLSDEIKERQQLNRALESVLDKRRANQT
jgi:hypothetical protein